jgi:hypothetical protein
VTAPLAAPRPATSPAPTIVDAYLRIQQALSADTIDSIRGDARTIEIEATALGADGESIRSAAAGFREAADLTAARAAFAVLSDRMIARIRSEASPADVSVAFCPMAQRYWLQRGERIQNPYYGKAMPDCGRFVTER